MVEKELVQEFKRNRNIYLKLEETVMAMMNQMVSDNHFFVMEISHRTKEVASFEGKLKRKKGKYSQLKDITDLVGIRIICYFSDTVDEIASKLASVFDIDWDNSIDKRQTISATQFGYLSVHYICSLGEQADCDEALKGIPFEIQMRTVLQHAWAEIEHDLGYKSEFGVPRAIRREFSQTASLLEIADRQFVEIRESSKNYTRLIREKIKNNDAQEILLDRISLREYFRINKELLTFMNRLKTELHVDVEEVDTDRFLKPLGWFGIETLGEVMELFSRHKEFVYRQVKNMTEEFEIDIISDTVLLNSMCYGELLKEKYSEEQIRKFLSMTQFAPDKIERQLQKLKHMEYV